MGRASLLPKSSPHGQLGYRDTLRLPGRPFEVHVIGLDSAWASGGDNDSGKLLLTDDQVSQLTTDQGKPLPGFRLALVHHPLTDLADASICRRPLATNVDLLLRGHLHEKEIETRIEPDHTARVVAAGCLYEEGRADHWPNACHVIEVTLDPKGRPQRYDLRLRAWSSRGFWHDDDSFYRGSRGGRIRWAC